MGRYGPGVTYTVPRRAIINAPPPMGPLGGLMGDPGASFSKYPRGVNTQGGFDIFRSQISYSCSYGEVMGIVVSVTKTRTVRHRRPTADIT